MPFPRTAPLVSLVALIATVACTGGEGAIAGPRLPRPVGVDPHPTLTRFESCEQLEDAIEDGVVLRMKSALWLRPEAMGADVGAPASPGPSGPSEYTTTNAQVEGVGEADFVQNDGTRIAVVANGALHLVRSWPPESLATAASIPVEGWPHDLFLAGDRAIVFSAVYVPRALEGDAPLCPAVDAPGGAFACGYWANNLVKITAVDVSDLAAPAVLSEVYLPGSYVSARRIGDRVRLVVRDAIPFPEDVRLWAPVPPGASQREIELAIAALARENEALIRARSLDDWLRHGTVRRPGSPDVDVGYACTDYAASSAPVLPGIVTVATLDVEGSSLVSRTSLLGEGQVVYASRATLYVAAPHWWWWPEAGQRAATYLHAFDLADPDRASYLGSGVVDGLVRDQYALDEHEGALRVVATTSERVEDGGPWGRIETAGRLSVLAVRDGALALLGETPEFGAGETVFGTRLLGTRGFAITARVIDPLFTFDLSEPASPGIVGELEMPGFISYLHPIDDTHLLGVGREPARGGGPMQLKVALLDVSDLANPRNVSTALVGEAWSWSEVLWDPRAFTWFGARKLLAIPFAEWGSTTFTSDLRLFHVDPATGITPAGVLSMADAYLDDPATPFGWSWSPYVRRSILADEFVYAVSDGGIRSAAMAGLPAWLATIEFAPHPAP
jgi:hypothetical protein